MKKVYYFLFAAIGLASCSNEDVFEAPESVNNNAVEELNPNRRTYAEALEIAQKSITMLQDSAAITRGEAADRSLNLVNGVKAVCQPVTRANGTSNDTVLYVFNFNDDKGFALVSANRATTGLLAVIEKGSYDPNVEVSNPLVADFLQDMADYAANAESKEEVTLTRSYSPKMTFDENNINTVRNGNGAKVYTTSYKIEPAIKVQWAQTGIPAEECKYDWAGSGPVALFQVMSVFREPMNDYITTSYAKSATAILMDKKKWDFFCSIVNSDNRSNPNKAILFKDFSMIFRELGHRSKAIYSKGKTTTEIGNLLATMSGLGYTVGPIRNYDKNNHDDALSIRNCLKNGCIVVMQGTDKKTGTSHTFVIDGGEYETIVVEGYVNNLCVSKNTTKENYLHHINWGEAGKYDGLYFANTFSPKYNNNSRKTTFDGKKFDFSYNMSYFSVSHK